MWLRKSVENLVTRILKMECSLCFTLIIFPQWLRTRSSLIWIFILIYERHSVRHLTWFLDGRSAYNEVYAWITVQSYRIYRCSEMDSNKQPHRLRVMTPGVFTMVTYAIRSVGIVTSYGLRGHDSIPGRSMVFFSFLQCPRRALWSIHPSIECILGAFTPG
jgi:hypothetical protein